MLKARHILAAATVIGMSVSLSACSMAGMDMGDQPTVQNAPSNSADSAPVFNDSDLAFATQMAIHHGQAVEMAQTILDKTDIDPRVTELAQKIKDAQGPEIETLNSWITQWGSADMVGMDMGGGTMSASDMAALAAATGVDASRLFLTQMTVHHEGAIAMAQTQVDNGKNADAILLAQKIIDDQTAELQVIKDILGTL